MNNALDRGEASIGALLDEAAREPRTGPPASPRGAVPVAL